MKIEVLQEELNKGLSLVSRVVASRPQLAVLSNILLEAKKEGLVISATDLELGMGVKIKAKVLEEGSITVPAKTLYEFVSSLNPGKVDISLDKETLLVSAGSYRGKFQTIAAEEFPRLPEMDDSTPTVRVDYSLLAKAIQMVIFAAAKDSLRPVLTGMLLEIRKTGLQLVATDGFRLATQKLKGNVAMEESINLLIPMRAMAELSRVGGQDVSIAHIAKANQVIFTIGDTKLVTQLIEGNYPEYSKIIPKDFASEMTVSRDELTQAVKTSYIFARDNSNMMRWEVSEKELVVTAETPERGESTIEVPITLDGDGGKVVFNAKFVIDFLSATSTNTIRFGMGEALGPCAFREQGNEDFLYVVMPINA
jgi:DNA polymerase-3 subunit beta